MTTRMLPSLALGLALGTLPLLAQDPGDPDYEPDQDLVEQYEGLGGDGSDYEYDEDSFETAAEQVAADPPAVDPPSGGEIDEFRAGLEQHWNGNLPALLAYLNRLDPGSGDNPEPPEEGTPSGWHPSDDYDQFGNVIETAEEKRERWRRRVEQKLRQLAGSL